MPAERSKGRPARRGPPGPPYSFTPIVDLSSPGSSTSSEDSLSGVATRKRKTLLPSGHILPKQTPHPAKDPRQILPWIPEDSINSDGVLTESGRSAIAEVACGLGSIPNLLEMKRRGEVVRMRDEPEGAVLVYICTICHQYGIGDKCKSRHANQQSHLDKLKELLPGVKIPAQRARCNLCGLELSRTDALTRHKRTKHKDVVVGDDELPVPAKQKRPKSKELSNVRSPIEEDVSDARRASNETSDTNHTGNAQRLDSSLPYRLADEAPQPAALHPPYTPSGPFEGTESSVYAPQSSQSFRFPAGAQSAYADQPTGSLPPPREYLGSVPAFTFGDTATDYFSNRHPSYGMVGFAPGQIPFSYPCSSSSGSSYSGTPPLPPYSPVFNEREVASLEPFAQSWHAPPFDKWGNPSIQPFYGAFHTSQTPYYY